MRPASGEAVLSGGEVSTFIAPGLIALLGGFLILALPTFIGLSREVWIMEIGSQGPIVLATGAWLVYRCLPVLRDATTEHQSWIVALILALALPVYAFGRAYDFVSLEAAGVYAVMLAVAYRLFGWPALRSRLFPFLYLGFLVPPPGWAIDRATQPLQKLVSAVATDLVQYAGYPVARDGVTITIAQYQLLIEDACSGMNSIFGLTAIMLFYIYVLYRSSLKYALILIALIVPIAVIANIVRVVCLILLTYYFGDGVTQGFLHMGAGILLFSIALTLTFAADAILRQILPEWITA